jgi:hypothetical protein
MSDKQKHSEGPWAAVCDEARGNPRCLIVDKNGHEVASVNPYCETWNENASLIMDAPRMLELIRDLHDFAEPMRHWQYAEKARQAFRDAAILLGEHNG